MTNPLADPYLVLSKVYTEGSYLKQALASTPVEPLNRARTSRICYGVLEKDIYLSYIISQNTQKQPKAPVRLILKIALYMLEFMDKHDYMVIDCAVELAKKAGKGGVAGFINGFLRGYKLPAMPVAADERLSIECSAPLWLVKKIRRSYKLQAKDILATPSSGICVRFVRNAEKYSDAEHIETPFKDAYIFKNFVRDGGYDEGDYTFQSIGSIAICSAISPCENILDACAAPGGKSVLLAGKCKSVTSCEIHPHRAGLIASYASRMGVNNVTVRCEDSSAFNKAYDGVYDAVLCDVPCSGSGVINENPDIKLFRKEEDIASLNKVQTDILENCSRYVKNGGRLYYSTCSVLPEENDSIIYNFLQLHPEYSVITLQSPLQNVHTKYGMQFLPHISFGAGFYLACIEKAK